jgi:hypothetical protein
MIQPVMFNGFGIMAVQLYRREISFHSARMTLEIMDGCDDELRQRVTWALQRGNSKVALAKELESIQDWVISRRR